MKINFEYIKENCKTIEDVQKLTSTHNRFLISDERAIELEGGKD